MASTKAGDVTRDLESPELLGEEGDHEPGRRHRRGLDAGIAAPSTRRVVDVVSVSRERAHKKRSSQVRASVDMGPPVPGTRFPAPALATTPGVLRHWLPHAPVIDWRRLSPHAVPPACPLEPRLALTAGCGTDWDLRIRTRRPLRGRGGLLTAARVRKGLGCPAPTSSRVPWRCRQTASTRIAGDDDYDLDGDGWVVEEAHLGRTTLGAGLWRPCGKGDCWDVEAVQQAG